jgi:hypothetical protein
MRTIGIRVKPRAVTFSIYDSDTNCIVNVETIRIPEALSTPEALKYIRNNILDILREYDVQQGGIRTTEPSAQTLSIDRIQIEGVIQESFASSKLIKYFIGHISNISSRVGINRADFKRYVEGDLDYVIIEGWADYCKEER